MVKGLLHSYSRAVTAHRNALDLGGTKLWILVKGPLSSYQRPVTDYRDASALHMFRRLACSCILIALVDLHRGIVSQHRCARVCIIKLLAMPVHRITVSKAYYHGTQATMFHAAPSVEVNGTMHLA